MARLLVLLSLLLCAFAASAQSQDLAQVRGDFARTVYATSSSRINHDAPQPLLRAVVVMRVKLDEQGRWAAEVLRQNDVEPELTRQAVASVEAVPAPADVPESLARELHANGFVEVWLFQADGRFALKTLALPQRAS